MKRYDVVVLGAGPGGYVSAIRAAQLGARTAVIERDQVGGTCLNTGCIPTKSLMKNVEILHDIKLGERRGITVKGEVMLDYRKAIKAKNSVVRQLVSGVEGLLASNGIDLFRGTGRVEDGNVISIEGGQEERIQYEKLIIATGSSPVIPPVKGMDLTGVVTGEGLLQMETAPEHLIIIGGGVIGCEFATIFRACGSRVTIIEMMPVLVSGLDQDVSDHMKRILEGGGTDLQMGRKVRGIAKKEDGTLEVAVEDQEGQEEKIAGDLVLVSVGRRANLHGLENLALEMEQGTVRTDGRLETSKPGVYAVGDVTGKRQLAHVASAMGILAAENAMGAEKTMGLDAVPGSIFTIPEVGTVGLTESEAKAKGHGVLIGTFPLMACGKAVAAGEPDGLFKVVADRKSRKLLGAHLIGKNATEVVAEMCAYLRMGATIDDVTSTIHSHPTISEAVCEAVRDLDGCAIHMPKKGGA